MSRLTLVGTLRQYPGHYDIYRGGLKRRWSQSQSLCILYTRHIVTQAVCTDEILLTGKFKSTDRITLYWSIAIKNACILLLHLSILPCLFHFTNTQEIVSSLKIIENVIKIKIQSWLFNNTLQTCIFDSRKLAKNWEDRTLFKGFWGDCLSENTRMLDEWWSMFRINQIYYLDSVNRVQRIVGGGVYQKIGEKLKR